MYRLTVAFNGDNKSFLETNPFAHIDGVMTEDIFGRGRFMCMTVPDEALGHVEKVVKEQNLLQNGKIKLNEFDL